MNSAAVSTSTSPSPVAKAVTLANDGTNTTPSQTSAKPPECPTGLLSAVEISPRQNRSATSSTSDMAGPA